MQMIKRRVDVVRSVALLGLLFCYLILPSCTVTKRYFGSGYHVEWKKNFGKEKTPESNHDKITLSEENTSYQENAAKEPVVMPEVYTLESKSNNVTESLQIEVQTHQKLVEKSDLTDSEFKLKPETMNQVEPASTSEQQSDEIKDTPKKTEPLTWVAMALFIASLIFGIWVGALFSSAFTMVLGMTFLGFAGVLFGLVLIFFVFSLISFIRIKRNPGMYKNKALTKVLLGISMVALTAAGIILSIALAFDSSKPMMQGW